jgi:hypothetical protein
VSDECGTAVSVQAALGVIGLKLPGMVERRGISARADEALS